MQEYGNDKIPCINIYIIKYDIDIQNGISEEYLMKWGKLTTKMFS